jgi:hypothetical protein
MDGELDPQWRPSDVFHRELCRHPIFGRIRPAGIL